MNLSFDRNDTRRTKLAGMARVKARVLEAAALGVLSLAFAGQAAADLTDTFAAVSFPFAPQISGGGFNQTTVGWAFTIDADSTVTHLGIFNWNFGAGFANDRQVGIWNSAGSLVANATVPAGGVGAEFDASTNFYFVALMSSVLLQAGEQYTIGAWYNVDNNPGVGFSASVTPISGLNYLGARQSSIATATFEKPTSDLSGTFAGGFFGPNLRFSSATVPVELLSFTIE